MRNTLKIRTRLSATVAFVAFWLALISGLALWNVRGIGARAGQLVRVDAPVARASAQFAMRIADLSRYQDAGLLELAKGHPGDADLKKWQAARQQAADLLKDIQAAPEAAAASAALARDLRVYEMEFKTVRDRMTAQATPLVDPTGAEGNAMRTAFGRLEQRAGELFTTFNAQVESTGREVDRELNMAYISLALGLVFGVLLVGGAAHVFVYRPILAEADDLSAVCDAVAVGDLSRRVPDPSDTELGRVARSLNGMLDGTVTLVQSKEERDRMQAAVTKLLEEVSGVAEGDLTSDAEVTPDVTGAVADAFNFMIAELRRIIGQVQSTSHQVRTSLADLRAITEKLAAGSDDQAAQAVEASIAIEEMAASIHYVSENAASSASVAEQARTNAEHGTRAVTRTIEGMKAVRDQVQETAKRIKRLGESSQEIGEIVELIGDIADRTSILALNASIQAAMAGEAGRGFAVVAEEVERLADRATEATKRAGMLVKTTQSETAEVMAAMEDTTREVVNRSNIANEAGAALSEIQAVSNRLAELIQAISDAAQQQAKGSEQVARSMTEMSSVTKNSAMSTKATAASINSLAQLVDDLNDAVSRFRLPAPTPEDVSMGGLPRLVAAVR